MVNKKKHIKDDFAGAASQVLSHVLTLLPLSCELHEARSFHRLFVSQVSNRDVRVLGANMEHGSTVLAILNKLKESVDSSHAFDASNPDDLVQFWKKQTVDYHTWTMVCQVLSSLSSQQHTTSS